MTQVYIGFSINGADGINMSMRDNLFYAADSIGLDTTLCDNMRNSVTDEIHSTAQEIFKTDIMKLLTAKCAILELSNPSHEVGFCAGYLFSDRPKLPVLGLISKLPGSKDKYHNRLSPMIVRHPAITIREYDTERAREQLPQIIYEWLVSVEIFAPRPSNGPIILLTGPPGAGKNHQAQILSKHFGIQQITERDILSLLPNTHPFYDECWSNYTTSLNSKLPLVLLKQLTLDRLKQKNCRKGYILDEYPFNNTNIQILKELGIQPTLIIQIWADRETCIKNLITSGEHPEFANRLLDSYTSNFPSLQYKRETLGIVDEFEGWFPDCRQISCSTICSDITPNKCFNILLNCINFPFPVPPINYEYCEDLFTNQHSTRLHFHINAACQSIVIDLANKSQLPSKVYPIDTLIITGSKQLTEPDYSSAYAKIPNFGIEIKPGDRKAFATGILTEETIPRFLEFMNELSRVPEDERNHAPIMIEVEEYIWIQKQSFDAAGKRDGIETKDYSPGWYGWSCLSHQARDQLASQNSLTRVDYDCYEIHHSLDIPKLNATRSEIMSWLTGYLQKIGNIGGVFIFEKPCVWSIRTNEFYKGNYIDCKTEALTQQQQIECPWLIKELETSIELVHGIWTTP
jgi:adenylate kinase family enzyme